MAIAVECILKGQTIFWGAPTFDQTNIAWNEMYQAVSRIATFTRSRMEVSVPGGGKVIFRSLDDPDNARGHTANGIVIDEAPQVNSVAWYEVLRPIISDTNGWALCMGTPKGRNWFWREFMSARDYTDSCAWQAPTLGVKILDGKLERVIHPLENPEFPFDEALRIFQTVPSKTFEQEFLSEFVEDAGLVFRDVLKCSTLQPDQPQQGHAYVMGVDWARTYDWTVLSVIDATTNKQVALDRFNRIDYQFQLERLRLMNNRWQPYLIIAEANAMGLPLIEQLQREQLPVQAFTTTLQSKTAIIEALTLAMESQRFTLLNDETQIAELQAYDMERLPSGHFRYGAPQGMHDDTVMALAMAWWGISNVSSAVGFML
jgi:hypothetical protein